MNREDIIRMAREAGIVFDDRAAPFYERLVHSACAAGAAAEREVNAQELEEASARLISGKRPNQIDRHVALVLAHRAAAIRARGQA